ncbi:DEAD/DEAH box helicase [Egicoccus sp. AB-alg6-2]|uniref:DEAD/DEAH box helicase n=1 Tax=Egicoccus sp. AB-alg6-2 TaxID=3242692 RepID=UPI00359EDD17
MSTCISCTRAAPAPSRSGRRSRGWQTLAVPSGRRPRPGSAPTDPRDVLELLGRTSASGAARERAAEGGARNDEGLVHLAHLPARAAVTVPVPEELPAALRSRLEHAGVAQLYVHQEEAWRRARAGEHLVVATGTASGKSLCYQLPVLERLLTDDRAVALYLAPTKALAHDQLRALRGFRLPQVRAAVVDGDTPPPEREAVRRTANWLLTNPDLLHHAMLPNHRWWRDLIHRLAYVVVDEAHVARGVFGGHVALVLRRLRRVAERYGADPTFLLASATVGNPAEHASALVGVDVAEILRDGSPRGPMDVGLWQPPFVSEDREGRRSLLGETGDLLASFVAADVQTLVFTRSRKGAEVVALQARQRLGDATDTGGEPLAKRVAAYRAGYLAEERRALEADLRSGALRGVAATEALELGIDVAGLDAVVLAGWPGTTASFWQRLGRAGRAGGAAAGVLVAQEDPLDHYLVTHPDELLTRAPEDAILDPTNPYLLGPHLRCACQEFPLDDDEASDWFGDDAPALLAADVAAGRLRVRGGQHFWTSRRRASAEVDLRSAGGRNVRIVDVDTGALIGDVDEARAHRQVHEGAVYLHQGRQFEVRELDLDRAVALAVEAPRLAHTTRPRSDTDVRMLEAVEGGWWDEVEIGLARVEVTTQVTGYDVLRLGSDEVLDRVDLDLPPVELRTVAVWYAIPMPVLESAGVALRDTPGSLHAAEHAAIGMLPLLALCDRWDLGGLSTALHPDTGRPSVFVYDGYPGGAGLAERSYRRLAEHLRRTRETIVTCRCKRGCPSCVQSPKCGNGNDPLDKDGAVRVLDLLLARAPS